MVTVMNCPSKALLCNEGNLRTVTGGGKVELESDRHCVGYGMFQYNGEELFCSPVENCQAFFFHYRIFVLPWYWKVAGAP